MNDLFIHTDYSGDRLAIAPSDEPEHDGAVLSIAGGAARPVCVCVAPHHLAAVVTAMYQAAGQPVPDLPDIPDPAHVSALARDLHDLICGDDEHGPDSHDEYDEMARALLAKGWKQ